MEIASGDETKCTGLGVYCDGKFVDSFSNVMAEESQGETKFLAFTVVHT